MSNKKWYNYFVVTTPTDSTSDTPPPASAPPRRVADIVPRGEGETTFAAPVSTTELAEIYTAAKITTPAHGYTVLKVAEMLQNEHIRSLAPDVKQRSIMVALDAAGVKIGDIIEDAVRRDRALDTYERVLQKSLEDLRAQKAAENQQIQEEIDKRIAELRTRVEQNNAELTAEQNNLLAWRVRKRQEEDRIAEAVGHFVSENPITTSGTPSDKGGSNVR